MLVLTMTVIMLLMVSLLPAVMIIIMIAEGSPKRKLNALT
jgi:hypothetical protein